MEMCGGWGLPPATTSIRPVRPPWTARTLDHVAVHRRGHLPRRRGPIEGGAVSYGPGTAPLLRVSWSRSFSWEPKVASSQIKWMNRRGGESIGGRGRDAIMSLKKLGVLVFVLAAACFIISTHASAGECTGEYTWKCDDKVGNSCEGLFLGVLGSSPTEAFQESVPDLQCGNQQTGHHLTYALRFSGLPAGHHKLRMSFASQNVCGNGTDTESVTISKRVANNCDETGFYQTVATIGPAGSDTTDYDLGE